jgi:hypothetical protein
MISHRLGPNSYFANKYSVMPRLVAAAPGVLGLVAHPREVTNEVVLLLLASSDSSVDPGCRSDGRDPVEDLRIRLFGKSDPPESPACDTIQRLVHLLNRYLIAWLRCLLCGKHDSL